MATPVAGLSGLAGAGSATNPYRLEVSPLGLLLAAGRATAAIGPTSIARFNTVGWWAVYRWYWTVDVVAAGRVDLVASSDKIKSHHRSAFSETLGLAASLLLAEYLLARGLPAAPPGAAGGTAPVVVDVDSLLPGNGLRPDLWVLAGPLPTAGPPPPSILLEAKGRTPSGSILPELAKGTDQVLAVSGPTRRIVAGVEVPRTTLTAFAIEVTPMGPSPRPLPAARGFPLSVPARRTSSSREERPVSEEARSPDTSNRVDLSTVASEAIARADAARLRAFAALDDMAFVTRRTRPIAPNVTVDLEGVTFRVNDGDGDGDGDGSVEVTVGLLADVAQDLRKNDSDPSRFERSSATARTVRASLPREDPSASAWGAVADDGCVISVRRL